MDLKKKKMNIGYRIGFWIASLHFFIVVLLLLCMIRADIGVIGILFLLEKIDFFLVPLMYSLPHTNNTAVGLFQLFAVNGILGTLIWSAIPLIVGILLDRKK